VTAATLVQLPVAVRPAHEVPMVSRASAAEQSATVCAREIVLLHKTSVTPTIPSDSFAVTAATLVQLPVAVRPAHEVPMVSRASAAEQSATVCAREIVLLHNTSFISALKVTAGCAATAAIAGVSLVAATAATAATAAFAALSGAAATAVQLPVAVRSAHEVPILSAAYASVHLAGSACATVLID